MDFLKSTIDFKWPALLIECIFLIGGVLLIISAIKIRKQSFPVAVICLIVGIIITLISIYILFITIIFGYNS